MACSGRSGRFNTFAARVPLVVYGQGGGAKATNDPSGPSRFSASAARAGPSTPVRRAVAAAPMIRSTSWAWATSIRPTVPGSQGSVSSRASK